MKITFNVYREDIPHPIPFWKKGRAFVIAYCKEATRKTGLRHLIKKGSLICASKKNGKPWPSS
jgi:hypothetical protein